MHESHTLCIDHLLACGAAVNAREAQGLTALHVCSDTPAARRLVAAGAEVQGRDGSGRMPIHYASHENTIMLLEEGSPVDPRDQSPALRSCLLSALSAAVRWH